MTLGGLVGLTLGAVLLQLDRQDYQHLLENIRASIRKVGLLEKQVMHACGVSDPALFSKMLNGKARMPLDVYAAMPPEVHQQMVIEEAVRVGVPETVKRGALVMMALHTKERREA